MKAKSSIFVSFAVGAVLASLPYTLSIGKANAQAAGPAQQGGFNGQAVPPQGGFGGGGAFSGQGQRFGGAAVNNMITAGSYLFVSAGDTIYKIDINSMKITGETKLPAPRFQQAGNNPSRRPIDQPARAGGNIPPAQKD